MIALIHRIRQLQSYDLSYIDIHARLCDAYSDEDIFLASAAARIADAS